MDADILMKQGDLQPPLSVSLTDDTGNVVDVTTALSVKFRMAPSITHVELFSRDATIDDGANGQFSYLWQAGDTDTAGTFYGEFVVTWSTGPQTFPVSGYLTIVIEPKL
jgi:hypothetical protein